MRKHFELADDKIQHDGRIAVVSDPSCTPDLLAAALKDEHWEVRWAAAKNPNLIPELLAQALKDKTWFVRQASAAHPNCDPDQIRELLTREQT